MGKISFTDDSFKYLVAFIKKDYQLLSSEIIESKNEYDYYVSEDDILAGYSIKKNHPVSEIYGFNVYVVKFSFSNISTLHSEKQMGIFTKLLTNLKTYMNQEEGGYYNLRIPSHVVDLIKALNVVFFNKELCGGTVEEYILGKNYKMNNPNNISFFSADNDYINNHSELLLEMAYSSFDNYQGQYHISSAMGEEAGRIYKKWMETSLYNLSDNEKVFVAEYKGSPAGFVTTKEDENAVEGVLAAVDNHTRGLGVYKSMIVNLINYAYNNNKAFFSSTQFDNYIVQGTWSGLGLKPFYSIYNIHIDNRIK